jgi:hypothetical protein
MKEKLPIALTGYFLTRSYHRATQPFASIMDLPRAEADTLTARFTRNISDKGSYSEHRRLVEAWLRKEAGQAGVQIRNPHPLYFFLTSEPKNRHEEADMLYVSLPAAHVDLSACSATIGDSFCGHQHIITGGQDRYGLKNNPFMGRVLSLKNPAPILEGHRILAEEQREGYVEIQMWNRLPADFIPGR